VMSGFVGGHTARAILLNLDVRQSSSSKVPLNLKILVSVLERVSAEPPLTENYNFTTFPYE
jgi:hypothetical protein